MNKEYIKPEFLLESLESDTVLAADEMSQPGGPGYEDDDKDQGFSPWIPLY